jgi:hypothetical protein
MSSEYMHEANVKILPQNLPETKIETHLQINTLIALSKNVDGRCTSSHENKTFRSRSVVKQKGMVFGFRKTATAVTRPER